MTAAAPTPTPASAGETIGFTLNGEPMSAVPGTTLAALIERLGHAPRSVATSVNGEFVARDARAGRRLAEGDQVMTFQPIVGG